MTSTALITKNSVYLIDDGRWVKATGLRDGRPSDGLGGFETISKLRRGTVADGWTPCAPSAIQVGDVVDIASNNYWGATTPVLSIIRGGDSGMVGDIDALLDADVQSLILAREAAFLVGGGKPPVRICTNGHRAEAAREQAVASSRYAAAFTVTEDLR